MREVILAYLKKKAAVAIKPWQRTKHYDPNSGIMFRHSPKSEKIFRDKNQQTYDADTFKSINHYSGAGFFNINEHLKGKSDPSPYNLSHSEIEAHIDNIDRGMDRSPLDEDTVLWRGVLLHNIDHVVLKRLKELGALISTEANMSISYSFKPEKILDLKGFTYNEPTYLSTSLNRKVADNFSSSKLGSSVTFKIKAPKGTQAIYMPGAHKTWGDSSKNREDFQDTLGESEVLLDRGLKYKVTNVMTTDKANKHLLVSVEVVK